MRSLGCVITAVLTLSTAAVGLAASPPSFSVEPAVTKGRPCAVLREAGDLLGTTLTQTVRALNPETTDPLLSRDLVATCGLRLEMPEVLHDTHVELLVTTGAQEQDAKPLFRWRTLLRHSGSTLLSYPGCKEMMPPKDFEQYWRRARQELAAVALEPTVTRVPDKDSSTGLLHRVELPSVENTSIVCWYFVPRAAFDAKGEVVSKHPAILIAPGYGADEPPIDRTSSGVITLSINPRSHGPSKEFWKSPVDPMLYSLDDPEHYYYRLAFLDCARAAEFVFSRPEVDAHRVATEGGSQGGLFAIATAALEPRIACVCSNVTAFSDYPDGMLLALVGHHAQFHSLVSQGGTTATQVNLTLSYTDGANMATRVRCPVQINMAGQDPVCPYVCGIVTHNRLPQATTREFNIVPDARHEVTPQMRRLNAAWYKRWLKL